MKKTAFTLVLILSLVFVTAQNYGNIWQFSNSKGLDFNSCSPAVITGSNTGFEGCSAISNSSGQLLFYTNSDKVWNSSHAVMPNGNLGVGYGTLSQVLIVPKPLSRDIYYVITTKVQATGTVTLQYHVVDMNLNAGSGDVTSKNNSMSAVNITEQVCATYHSNGVDIWILTHEYGTSSFLAFLLTPGGISTTPVISNVGPAHVSCISNMNARGEIKFSPNGNKVAFNANGVGGNDASNLLCLFDFDKSTGTVSNPINLPFSRGEFGLSFSPDNSKLYGSTWKVFNFTSNDYNYLYQFDLSSNTPSSIVSSRQILDSLGMPESYGTLKIGPDGKMYVRYTNTNFLGVIQSPNQPAAFCNYVKNGLFIGYQNTEFGLNNYIEYTNYCTVTGLNERDHANRHFIYPNPSWGKVTINLPDKNTRYRIFFKNPQGSILKVVEVNGLDEVDIDTGDLNTGIYFYSIEKENTIIHAGKLMVK